MLLPQLVKYSYVGGRGCLLGLLALFYLTLLSTTNRGSAHANVIPGMGGLKSDSQKWWHGWEDLGEPQLAAEVINVTAIPGQTVTLPCRVTNLNDKTVSWIRSRDLTVLAVDRIKVSTDARIAVLHQEESEDWQLEIRGVAPEDAGGYDCQINTHPKISTKVNLIVLTGQETASIHDIPVSDTGIPTEYSGLSMASDGSVEVRILGDRRQEIGMDETLQLVCVAKGTDIGNFHAQTRPPNHPLISWTVDDRPITALFPHHQIDLQESWGQYSVESIVTVRYIQLDDGGTFACHVPMDKYDKVTVNVVQTDDDGIYYNKPTRPTNVNDQGMMATAGAMATTCVIGVLIVLLILQTVLCYVYIKRTT